MADWLILVGIGGVFILLGIAAVIRGRGEEKSYYDAISTRNDVREFVEHVPERPEPGALRVGGRIAIIIGIILVAMGGGIWLWS